MTFHLPSVSKGVLLGLVVLALPACDTLRQFSADGHSDGTYRGNSYSSTRANYVPGVVYPDAQGNELGYQALGRDLSDGSVEIYSLGGPEFVTAQQQRPAPLDSYPVNEGIPTNDSSVVVYDLGGAVVAQQTVVETGVILPPPTGTNRYPSPFVATNDPTTIIATAPPVQEVVVERTVTTVESSPITAPTMTGPQ